MAGSISRREVCAGDIEFVLVVHSPVFETGSSCVDRPTSLVIAAFISGADCSHVGRPIIMNQWSSVKSGTILGIAHVLIHAPHMAGYTRQGRRLTTMFKLFMAIATRVCVSSAQTKAPRIFKYVPTSRHVLVGAVNLLATVLLTFAHSVPLLLT